MLGVIAGIALPLLFLFPFSLISRYEITREAHAEIRRQLDERHRTTGRADDARRGERPGLVDGTSPRSTGIQSTLGAGRPNRSSVRSMVAASAK